jgi:N-methylhydantoinase A
MGARSTRVLIYRQPVQVKSYAMKYKVGIDIGGTFTDLIAVNQDGNTLVHKTLSTPSDPSEGFINGLREMAQFGSMSPEEFIANIDAIVHGTTVATNALLTQKGAVTALITTRGFRDALEMRRGIREEQYNNRYRNVEPLVPRNLRFTVAERTDADGSILTPIEVFELEPIVQKLIEEHVEAVAICFMHSYKNAENERIALSYLRGKLPDCFVISSHEVLPSVRFYERLSTTVVSAFVGPIVAKYLDKLTSRLHHTQYKGSLLIMTSNGGVMSPEAVKRNPAVTVLSGPAAAPTAGAFYAARMGYANCITADMGGTSFDAALVINHQCVTGTEGSINRYRIALPSLDIITIGAGGGSIGRINEGGLMQMGPQSAGAMPGPVCYGRGGETPSCTDADLILGYLNPQFFAGGRLPLDAQKAHSSISEKLALPLGISVQETAAGMFRIINNNMAQGVRQISVERGYDPREFLFIVSGGAGSIHASEICKELEIPLFLVPNVSSIFCAAGMLLGDLKHDYIRSCFSPFSTLDKALFLDLFEQMKGEGMHTLVEEEGVVPDKITFQPTLDMRYTGQYHEVQLDVAWDEVIEFRPERIFEKFHAEHNRQFGYSLEEEGTELELINVRLRVTGATERPRFNVANREQVDIKTAIKAQREIYIPESGSMQKVPVYDGDKSIFGAHIQGPCIIEKVTTSILVSAAYDCIVDDFGSFIVYDKAYFPNGYTLKSSITSSAVS